MGRKEEEKIYFSTARIIYRVWVGTIQMQIITTKINLLYDFICVFLLRWRTVLSKLLMTLRRWRRKKWSIDRSITLWHFEAQEKVKNRMVLSTFAAFLVNHFYHFSMSISSLFTFTKPQAFGFRSFQNFAFWFAFVFASFYWRIIKIFQT